LVLWPTGCRPEVISVSVETQKLEQGAAMKNKGGYRNYNSLLPDLKREKTMNDKTNEANNTIKIKRPESSERVPFCVVPCFPEGTPKATVERSPNGSSGKYRVLFVLARPGTECFHTDLDIELILSRGDSLLKADKNIYQIRVDLSYTEGFAEIFFTVNHSNRLAFAETVVKANNFVEAEKFAHTIINPIISWWSFRFDISLIVDGYQVEELGTYVKKWVFGVEGEEKEFVFDGLDEKIKVYVDLNLIFAAYREGLNSANPLFQCLSFYKVIEGIKNIEELRNKEAKEKGQSRFSQSETFPSKLSDLPKSLIDKGELFAPYLGRKFNRVLDQIRTPIRNAYAHMDPNGEYLTADSYEDMLRCEQLVLVIKFMSREKLNNELDYRLKL
jgi:hypothetical protein